MDTSNRTLANWMGLLGLVSFVSYLAAVVFAPSAYPDYDWMSRAVSDLSAADAPSLSLWHQLSAFYGVAGVVCLSAVCIAVKGKLNKTLRSGIYIFAIMFWVSIVGFAMFPLSLSGGGEELQDIMHMYVVLPIVVLMSIISLTLIIIGGFRKKGFVSLAICAAASLALMLVGGIGTAVAPPEYFGVFQRFSNVLAVNGFVAALGIYLFVGKLDARNVC